MHNARKQLFCLKLFKSKSVFHYFFECFVEVVAFLPQYGATHEVHRGKGQPRLTYTDCVLLGLILFSVQF